MPQLFGGDATMDPTLTNLLVTVTQTTNEALEAEGADFDFGSSMVVGYMSLLHTSQVTFRFYHWPCPPTTITTTSYHHHHRHLTAIPPPFTNTTAYHDDHPPPAGHNPPAPPPR